jgi:hypothetical protein
MRTPIAKDNLVYLYSCDTLSVETSVAPYAFVSVATIRDYIGFNEPVSPLVCDSDTKLFTGTCADHILNASTRSYAFSRQPLSQVPRLLRLRTIVACLLPGARQQTRLFRRAWLTKTLLAAL